MLEQVLLVLPDNWGLLLCAVGLGVFVGTATGLFGVGGGFIVTPALNVLLGVPMSTAVGTCAASVLGGSSFALWRQLDRRMLGIRVAGIMAVGILPGAWVGAQIVAWAQRQGTITVWSRQVIASEMIIQPIFAVFLTFLTCWFFIDNFLLRRGPAEDENEHRGLLAGVRIPPLVNARTIPAGPVSAPLLLGFGLGEGFLAGLLGIGGSVIMMPVLFYLVGQKTKSATQTCLMLAFVAGMCSTINHAVLGNIDYALVASLLLGSFSGTKIGTVIRGRITGRSIRRYFTFVVLAAVLIVIYKLYIMFS